MSKVTGLSSFDGYSLIVASSEKDSLSFSVFLTGDFSGIGVTLLAEKAANGRFPKREPVMVNTAAVHYTRYITRPSEAATKVTGNFFACYTLVLSASGCVCA